MRYVAILSLLTLTACGSAFTTSSEQKTTEDDAAPVGDDANGGGDHPITPEASTPEASDPPDVVVQDSGSPDSLSGHADAALNEAGDETTDSGAIDAGPDVQDSGSGVDASQCCANSYNLDWEHCAQSICGCYYTYTASCGGACPPITKPSGC